MHTRLAETAANQLSAPLRLRTVLLVEEDPSLRGFAAAALVRLGYAVVEAGSAREALNLWQQHSHSVEILFTDVRMGGMDGAKLAEILLRLNPRLKVVFSSGGYNESVQLMVATRSHVGFLSKPYTLTQLTEVLRHVWGDTIRTAQLPMTGGNTRGCEASRHL